MRVKNVVLVHGGFVDGAGWEGVNRTRDGGRTFGSFYASYTTEQLELILDFLTQATRRQQDATAKLNGGDA